ncbi:vesicle coat protein [Delphinella strobiligena]|nr:vesicle coat protein [Delphinella strobiligena]
MNSILALTHFCEIHGPQTILATRQHFSPSPSTKATTLPPPISETGTSCANCSYNVPETTTAPVLRSVSKSSNNNFETTLISSRVTSDALLREACIRVLSVETLGKGQPSGSFTVNTDISIAGNTETRSLNIAHVFRLQDPRARGGRRVYAFLAIGEPALFRHQSLVIRTFEAWAKSISGLAERHLRHLQGRDSTPNPSSGNVNGNAVGQGGYELLSPSTTLSSATPSPPLSLETPLETPSPPRFPSEGRSRHRASTSTGVLATTTTTSAERTMTPVSSFLSAKTVDPDGYPRSSLARSASLANIPKTRSLAEIVGDEFFFVRLHAEFCGLMRRVIESSVYEDYADFNGGSALDEESRMQSGSENSDDEADGADIMGNWRVDGD